MEIIVIGLGSMGRRRIRLLQKVKPQSVITGVDSNRERVEFARQEYGIEAYEDLEEVLEKKAAECAVICTSPMSHAAIIEKCLEKGLHVFTELNLVNEKYEENMALAKRKQRILFLSSTFLYRNELQYLMERMKNYQGRVNYNYHVGQYLPDWHPWENYNDFFVGKKETNGCRELFAIELPWMIKAFGEIENILVLADHATGLKIDYKDNYLVLLRHKTGHKGVLAVDVMSRKAVRNLEVYGERIHLVWDGTPDGLTEYDWENRKEKRIVLYQDIDTVQGYSSFIIENAYEKELRTFFRVIEREEEQGYSFREDLITLDWIDRIEKDG